MNNSLAGARRAAVVSGLCLFVVMAAGCSETEAPAEPATETDPPPSTTEAPASAPADSAAALKEYAEDTAAFAGSAGDIEPEAIGRVDTLPSDWPPGWIIAQDVSFFHMQDGKFIVLDISADTPPRQLKGFFNGSKIAQFTQASSKPEMYVAETFLSRGQRGERTDVLTIYDKSTLAPLDEVVIPPKRFSGMPTQFALQLTDNETKALVFNFTPAASVTVVDLDRREVLTELPLPGCAGIYPTGQSGFSTLCANGTVYSVVLAADGQIGSTARSEKFFDIDADALFERAAMHDGVAYFPTFLGNVVPIDLKGESAAVGERWSLLGAQDGGWRPGGLQLAASDAAGNLYVMMHPEGAEGTHKDPATEVWVFDTVKQQRARRIALQTPVLSIDVTRDDKPQLVATTIEMVIDVYAAESGEHIKTIGDFGQETPLLLHAAR